MNATQVLIVVNDESAVQELSCALVAAGLPAPVQVADGDSASAWIRSNQCGLCVISYELGGAGGLAALRRIQSSKPDLPAIVIARTDSQDAAIQAFRSGVLDFVPRTGDYARTVAEIARNSLTATHADTVAKTGPTDDPRLQDLPSDVMEPTYQNRLRVIGRRLDRLGYRSIALFEVTGGFLVRAIPAQSRSPEPLEFPDADFPAMVLEGIDNFYGDAGKYRDAPRGKLTPTGYEDLLRAIGYELDGIKAEGVLIVELVDTMAVSGMGNVEASQATRIEPFQMLLNAQEIEQTLNEAFLRRGRYPARQKLSKQTEQGGLRSIFSRLS